MSAPAPWLDRPLRLLARVLFAVYHDIRVEGAERVPVSGPVIVASNHPTYLDPAFILVGLERPVRFMAWDAPFRIPLLGALIRSYGSIPVDTKRPGRSSFEAAVKVLRSGAAFGIFPEGGRTKGGLVMNPFKSGVARLAMITGAPIVPVTITGGNEVWPKRRWLPKPGPIRVRFHEPIRVRTQDRLLWRRDKSLEAAIVQQVLDAIHQSLLPSLRAQGRVRRLFYAEPSPPSPWVEGIPFAFMLVSRGLVPAAAWSAYAAPGLPLLAAYLALLIVEQAAGLTGRGVKAARNLLPWLVLASVARAAMASLPLWELALVGAWLASMLWLQLFRFSTYRRVRGPALLVSYAGWLARLATLA